MAKDFDQFLGVEFKSRLSMLSGSGEDGLHAIERNGVRERFARAIFGQKYSGYTYLKANLEGGHYSTPVRGETIYIVKDGKVIERVDLPLFVRGKLDKKVEKGTLGTEQDDLQG